MAELSSSDWSETDASNDVTPPAGWPAGMQPNQVEPTARGMMGAIKRFWNRINPTYTSGGSAGAYTFTPSNTGDPTAYVQGEIYTFKANFTSVGADTLNVNSLGALGIYKSTGSGPLAIVAGDIQNNTMVSCAYDSALNGGGGGFQLIGGQVNFSGSAAIAAPNKFINPFMEIDQVNEGSSVSWASGDTDHYVIDGWAGGFHSSTATVSAQRVTDAPTGYPNSLKVTVGTGAGSVASTDYLFIKQSIEADNLVDTAFGTAGAQTLTLTIWLKSSISGTYSAAIQNAGTRSYPFNLVLSNSATWQKFSVSIAGDTGGTWVTSGNAIGMLLVIGVTVGSTYQGTAGSWASSNVFGTSSNTNTVLTTSGATFQLGPCKLEVGSVATPIVRDSAQQELARCQRYYEKSYDIGTALGTVTFTGAFNWWALSGTAGNISVPFKTPKRITAPTITIYSPNTGTSGKIYDFTATTDITASSTNNGMWGFSLSQTTGIGANNNLLAHWTSDARM